SGGGTIDLRPNPFVTLPTIRHLTVNSNGWITASSGGGTPIVQSIIGDLNVDTGGGFLFDGLGFAGGAGPGAGQSLSFPVHSGGGTIDLRPNPFVTLPTIRHLTVNSNGWITASSGGGTPIVQSIIGDLNVDTGGGFLFDGLGFAGGAGPGAGQSLSFPVQSGG